MKKDNGKKGKKSNGKKEKRAMEKRVKSLWKKSNAEKAMAVSEEQREGGLLKGKGKKEKGNAEKAKW